MDTLLAGRYELRAPVGRGAMGVVWEALDTGRGVTVALKQLKEVDADAVYRLKQEFRARADIAHPNLVSLYELVADAEGWFLTMELIDGMPFLDWIRGQDWRPAARSSTSSKTVNPATYQTPLGSTTYRVVRDVEPSWTPDRSPERLSSPDPLPSREAERVGELPPDVDRLRDAFRQLAEGIDALHAADRLHRDLKPANVLVTRGGRVVLVDFGLAAELRGGKTRAERGMAGTAAYMAPEQAMASSLTPRSDWYAVGVMLFEALTGLRPYEGTVARIIADKQMKAPPRPSEACPGVPDDLDALAHDLMSRDPADRPHPSQILSVLGAGAAQQRSRFLVGRSRHLRRLERSWKRAAQGETAAAVVRGHSGMGKSVLIDRFLESLDAPALTGRCYERERVPYNAFDDLVDDLAERLFVRQLSVRVPDDIGALRKVFPGLDRLPEFERVPIPEADAQEIRTRAFGALADLLRQLGPLVVHLDDVQWGDEDSLRLLGELLGHRPPILVLLSHRDEQSTPFIEGLARALGEVEAVEIEVGELSPREALDFALQLLGPDADTDQARRIAEESGGNPLFVEELCLRAGTGPVGSLDDLIAERVRGLPAPQRALVQLVSLAAGPLPIRAAEKATGQHEIRPILDLLCSANLVRTSSERVQPFHDRVRSAVSDLLVGEIREDHHRRLAVALQGEDGIDPGALFRHWSGAGELEQAVPWAVRAADLALDTLAFDRAAEFYAVALELGTWKRPRSCELHQHLGEALYLAGRTGEAGQAYLDASDLEDRDRRAVDLRRRAAEMFLEGGHTSQGLLVGDGVVRSVGLRLATHPRQAVLPLLGLRLRMWWRGLEPTVGAHPTEDDRFRMAVYQSMSRGLALVDFIQSEAFVYRHLLAALDAGDRQAAARGLLSLAATLGASSPRDRAKVPDLFARGEALCDDSPESQAFLELSRSMGAFANGDFEATTRWADTAHESLTSTCRGMQFEITSARMFSCWGLLFSGDLAQLGARLPAWLRQARERGNLRFLATAETELHSAWALAEDRVDDAVEVLEAAVSRYDGKTFQLPHQSEFLGRQQIYSYTGEVDRGFDSMEQTWPRLTRSLMLQNRFIRVEGWLLRARAAIAKLNRDPSDGAARRLAQTSVKKAAADEMTWSAAVRLHTEATLAHVLGDEQAAADGYRAAIAALEKTGQRLHASACRRRLGQLLGGDEGQRLVQAGDSWLVEQGVADREAITRMCLGT